MKKKGFTLIELLAVIVILAVIALIAVPQVLKIIYKAKLAAAEDSTLGIAYSTENYVGNFMLKNDGSLPYDGLLFICGDGCTLDTTNINDDYELNGLSELKFKGIKPTGGIVTVNGDGKNIIVEDLLIGEFVCNYPVDGTASCINKEEADKNKPLVEPTSTSGPDGYAQSKTGTISFSGSGTYLVRPTVNVTTNIAAINCPTVGDATADCNGTNVAANGTMLANKWYKVTSNPTLTFTENGSVSYKVIDGTNYKDGGGLTIDQIDRTAPTSASFTETHTTNSITVTASGTDSESGIVRYQFSKDNGSTWLPATPQTSNSYTFSDLTSGSYNIKVNVINGTYDNNGANSLNTTESETKSVTTGGLTIPTSTSGPDGYAQTKTGTISFSGSGTYLVRPSVNVTTNIAAINCPTVGDATADCNGANVEANGTMLANKWYKVTSNPTLTFTTNGSVSYKVIDGTNYKNGGALTIDWIDRTAPTAASFSETHTTNSITVTASGTDNESGIVRYQFSKDNGSTWLPATPQTSNRYTFSGLASGSYNIKVKVYNGTYDNNGANGLNTTESETKSVTLACNNTTKTVSCSKYCSGYGYITGYRYDTYDCNGNFVSAGGTCYGTCPTTTTTTTTARSCQEVYVGTVEHGSCGKNGAYDLICAIYEKTCTDGTISRYTKECTCR